MQLPLPSRSWRTVLCALLLPGAVATAGPSAHEHGALALEIVVEGPEVHVAMTAPLDSLLGFERPPRTPNEQRAAAALLARLRQPEGLFVPTPEARCGWGAVQVRAPVLESGAPPARGEHAELQAEFRLRCADPARLQSLRVELFEAFGRLRRVDARVAGPKGQSQRRLTPAARTLPLAP